MELVHPEHSISNKEVSHFILGIIKYLRSPVRMLSLSRVCILIYTASIEISKSMCILWKMCRYPVKNYTNSFFMHIIYKIHEILRCSVSCCRCIITSHLISPWSIIWILCNSHKFNMCISHIWNIFCKLRCQFSICIESVLCSIIFLLPWAKMTFIYRKRSFKMILRLLLLNPFRIFPFITWKIGNYWCCLWS